MSCTTCGSNVNCNCSTNRISCGQSVSCSACNGNGCNSCGGVVGCNRNIVPASPQPYYNCAPSCQESNTQKVVFNQFAAALKVVNTWNVPACGLSAVLTIPGLISIAIGSYLWNAEFGYFEVTAFDSGLQQVTVVNHCNEGNAAAGTNVPSCSLFLNTAPPAAEEPTNTPCVEIDFTAPDVGDCIDITLNNTNGILAGDIVQIGSGFYRVAEVKPNDIINICNDGDGITPGTAVIAKDATGSYQYCLQIISTSACDREVVDSGAVIVCNTNGQTTTVSVPEDSWILEGKTADGTNFMGAIPLGLPPTCTQLSSPLTIVAGDTTYTFAVDSTVGYSTGDIVQVAGYPATTGIPNARFTITVVSDATHFDATLNFSPGAGASIPTGTAVCRIGCCELLQNEIDALTEEVVCVPTTRAYDLGERVGTLPVVLNESNYFTGVLIESISTLVLPDNGCPGTNYFIVAHISMATLPVYTVSPFIEEDALLAGLGYIYHEIEVNWNNNRIPAGLRTAGKIVYTDSVSDKRTLYGFPVDSNATYNQLTSAELGLAYNQGTIEAGAYLPSTGGVLSLGASYRTLVGDAEGSGLLDFGAISYMLSGYVEVHIVGTIEDI